MVNPKPRSRSTSNKTEQLDSRTKFVPKQFTISITKTVQEPKFEPSVVGLSEVHDVPPGQDYDKMVRIVTKQLGDKVERAMAKEINRYNEDRDQDEDED